MKKYLLIVVLVLFVNTVIHGQRRGGEPKGGDRAAAMISSMSEQLELDDRQQAQFEETMELSMKERKGLRDQDLSKSEMRDEFEAISKKENDAVAKILDEEQYQEFLSIKKEMRQRAREERKSRGK